MQGTAAISDEDDYQIPKSLRIESTYDQYLDHTFLQSGNRNVWTLSFWIRRNKISNEQTVFNVKTDDSNQTFITFYAGTHVDAIGIWAETGNTTQLSHTTETKFKDPNAWYHFVFISDNNYGFDIYCNGTKQPLSSGGNVNPTGELYQWNKGGETLRIGKSYSGTAYNASFNLADVQFIDGLALSPAAFGKFDASNSWQAKTFALPTPNNGTTWSSNCTFTNTDRDEENLFDGLLGNSAAGVIQDNSSNTAKVTFNTEVKGYIFEVWNDSSTNVIGFNTETPDQHVSGAGLHSIYE